MSSAKDLKLSSESAEDKTERRLQRRCERERACHVSETVEQREERLSRRRFRDRVRHAAVGTKTSGSAS